MPSQRLTEKFDARVLEIDHLFVLVVDYSRGLDLPQRRFFRIVLAWRAGGIDAIMENSEVATRSLGAGGRHARLIRRVEAQRVRRIRRGNRPTGP